MNLALHASIYDGLCSGIEDHIKWVLSDDAKLPPNAVFSRFTVKVRTMGTNNYIAIGSTSRNFRFIADNQSETYIAPIINGSVVPLDIGALTCYGDVHGGAGVLELRGIRVYEMDPAQWNYRGEI